MSNIIVIEEGAIMAPDIDGWTVDYMGTQDFTDCLSAHNSLKDLTCKTSGSEYEKWNSSYKMICYKNGTDIIGFVLRGNKIRYITSNISDEQLSAFVSTFLTVLNTPVVLYASGYQSYTYSLYLRIGKLLNVSYKSRGNLNVFIWEIK